MQVKTHPPVTVLYSQHKTTIKQLGDFVGVVMKELIAEVVSNDALVSGPPCWIYRGMDGKPDTVFTLEIAIPVQGPIKTDRFPVKHLPPFKAVTHTHEGTWQSLPLAYGQIMQHIDSNKIPMNEESREYYLNMDFQHPENNITQIQVGVI